jgi:GTPase SAR1 family protein
MGVFLVYDVTNQKSFDNIKMWLQNIQSRNTEIMLITLIGNKSDLENKRVVTTDVGKIFAKENNLDFYETSAKNNDNIDQIFINASKKILSNITKSIKTPQHIIENVIVKESEHQQRDKCCYFF